MMINITGKSIFIAFSFCILSLCAVSSVRGNPVYAPADSLMPVIGKPMPDFYLNKITHYNKKQASLADFRGKWLFLDFWFTGCISCIKSFPKVNRFQQQFKDQLNWVMVGITNYSGDKHPGDVELMYEKFRAKEQLQMASAYDSLIANQWEVMSMPRIFVVDPQGILRYITDGRDMTVDKLRDLFDGKDVSLYRSDIERPDFSPDKYMDAGKKDSLQKMLVHSILTKWDGEKQLPWDTFDYFLQTPGMWKDGFQLSMVTLQWMYNLAYFGIYFRQFEDSLYASTYNYPILQVKDSSLFDYSYSIDFGKGLYSYFLRLPDQQVTKQNMMKFMQQDLKRAFNFEVSIEKVKIPVWKLVLLPGAEKKLLAKGGKVVELWDKGTIMFGFAVSNVPVSTCLRGIQNFIYETDRSPFIDATGITGNIDLTIKADMLNRDSIIAALRTQGLDLVKGEKIMDALVIRDGVR